VLDRHGATGSTNVRLSGGPTSARNSIDSTSVPTKRCDVRLSDKRLTRGDRSGGIGSEGSMFRASSSSTGEEQLMQAAHLPRRSRSLPSAQRCRTRRRRGRWHMYGLRVRTSSRRDRGAGERPGLRRSRIRSRCAAGTPCQLPLPKTSTTATWRCRYGSATPWLHRLTVMEDRGRHLRRLLFFFGRSRPDGRELVLAQLPRTDLSGLGRNE